MFLVELVMQGIRGFQQLARLRFQGGFNIISAGNESGKTTSVDSIVLLLFPVNDPSKMDILVSRAAPEGSRGALVVYSDDGSYYRVIQDLTRRAVNLSKYNASTKEFSLLHKDWDSTAQFMDGLLPGITADDYGRLLVFRRDACTAPSTAAAVPSTDTPRRAAAPTPAPAPAGRNAAQERKLAELKETLQKAEDAADAEYKAEAARVRLTEIAKKLERLEESRGRLEEVETQLAELSACKGLPENLAELISTHEQEENERAAKTNDVEKDIEALTMQRDTLPVANMVTEKLFIAGAAMGGIALILGLFILLDEQAIYFPILILASLLLIVAGWYNSSRKNAQHTAVQKEIDGLVKERAAIEKKFQDAGAVILKHMKATESKSAAELREKADNYRYFREMREEAAEQQRMALGGQAEEDVRAEYAAQQAEVATLEQASRAVAKYAVDTYSLRQEIERIEGAVAPAVQQDPGFADFGAMTDFSAPSAAPGGAGGSDLHDLVALASRISGIEMEILVPAVESAAQRNITAVSGGRYVKIETGQEGHPVVQDAAGNRLSFDTLSDGTRLMACFCLRAAIVEAIVGKRRLPFLLDDPFAGMDPPRQQQACQLLRVLGTKTQVLLFTSNAALRAPNDPASELK
ncbi:MAG: hypothetical protein OEW15_03730 [Nitrospirota bacterium]|nr:hypothetical protein [Nitrospirota bacterium]